MKAIKNKLIDLHLHMDGSISVKSAKQLALLQGIVLPESEEEIKKRLMVNEDCRDLNEYLARFDFPLSLLQSTDALETAAENLLRELKEQGLLYAEIRFAPQSHRQKGLTQKEAVEAVLRGMKKVPFSCGLILCCMRGEGNEKENLETIDLTAEFLGKGVCAADLAGAEAIFPTSKYAKLFEYARKKQIPYTIHAGEADGPESIRAALAYGAHRIGHGIRSVEEESLLKELGEKQILLEICPSSNLHTNIFESIEAYPIPKLLEYGICFSINTDNMSVSDTTVREEYEKLFNAHLLGEDDIRNCLLAAAEHAFLSTEEKSELKKQLLEV